MLHYNRVKRLCFLRWKQFTLRKRATKTRQLLASKRWETILLFKAWQGWQDYHKKRHYYLRLERKAKESYKNQLLKRALVQWITVRKRTLIDLQVWILSSTETTRSVLSKRGPETH